MAFVNEHFRLSAISYRTKQKNKKSKIKKTEIKLFLNLLIHPSIIEQIIVKICTQNINNFTVSVILNREM